MKLGLLHANFGFRNHQDWADLVAPLVDREASFFAGANWPEKNSIKFDPADIREITKVMLEHTHGRFVYGMNFITFENEQDCIMFNLVYRK